MLSLSRLDRVLNTFEQLVDTKVLVRSLKKFLKLCVIVSAIYGGCRGFQEALAIIRKRRPIRLTNKTL